MSENQTQLELEVPLDVAIQIKISEFDRAIADAEYVVSDLKRKKANFLHEQNMATVRNKYQKPPV